jgi:hypothetical protein
MKFILCPGALALALGLFASQLYAAETGDVSVPPPSADGKIPPPPPPMGEGGKPDGVPPPHATPYVLHGLRMVGAGTLVTETGRKYLTAGKDMSAVYVKAAGKLDLIGPEIRTSGVTSSNDNSSFHGLNAAVLATEGAIVHVTGGYISTTGSGANGLFATGKGSSITMIGGEINASGEGAHGFMTTFGGEISVTDVHISTSGPHAAPIATDRGGGKVRVMGGTFKSAGDGSPGIYSTGDIQVSGADIHATGAEAAVIEGKNTIRVADTALRGDKLAGVMIYQSFSGDADGDTGNFMMRGGSLSAAVGPLFYVTNSVAIIELSEVKLETASGVLMRAAADRWGHKGTNGGQARLSVKDQTLVGDIVAETGSSASLQLEKDSLLRGKIINGALKLDASSKWEVTGPSVLTVLDNPAGIADGKFRNIIDNGNLVRYDAKNPANVVLGGKTYHLQDGGRLAPN